MTAQTLSVFPAYLGGYDPAQVIADWNEAQSPTLVITQDLDASAAYLVVGGEPEAADEVFEQHSAWPSKPVIWIDAGGSLSLYRCAKDFGEVRTATFEEVFPAAQIAREDLLNTLVAVERALDDASSVVDPGEEKERAHESELHGLRSLIEQLGHGAVIPASGSASLAGITFGPMPEGKPTGGFLEIGECAEGEDTYPWEAQVEFLLGSNGVVYAEVEQSAARLPTLDDEGHAVSEEPAFDDRCPRCEIVDRGEADFIKNHGMCSACHAKWQNGNLLDQVVSVVRCPKCGGETIFVVQVACMEHAQYHTGHWPLNTDGFAWDESGTHRDGSTEDEIAECGDCGYCCPAGALHEFGFGEQDVEEAEHA